ncbi:exodeoxyribonuclease III [Halpernia frigidisoli]|uniref:Exodeoxyribonuclease-3 n=1 Tax=Halpernia frigidisoli TaxID=1125876 RepID=A0A1I3F2R6_9FLAO|nr:exodeoxyribonuclease III [Halpernia frigidisoli]SFI05529.1 exodeoxyribonuclease-3 [Halpernia frigidisoli]
MKIATYNVNGINGRLPVLLKWLEESKPDLVFLQELKAPQEKFPLEDINAAGYEAIWVGQKSWNGVAILSKNIKLKERRRTLPGNDSDKQSRYLEVETDDFILCCIYVPNGNPTPGEKYEYKLNWLEHFQAQAEVLISSGKKIIICGDFNIIPTEKDVYKPVKYEKDALFLPRVREEFSNLISLGFTDALRFLKPEAELYTFYDYFRKAFERNAGMRIDHFLLSENLEENLKTFGIDKEVRGWEKSSDHVPVWIEIDL